MKSVSKNYIATLTVDSIPLALMGLHFLARPNDESRRLDREAQADAIRQIAVELLADGRRLIVLGDFNDYDGETASRDQLDSTPISNVLKMVREMKPNDPADDLVNVTRVVPKGQRFTSWFDMNQNGQVNAPHELTAIDHILLSPELSAKLITAEIPHQHDATKVSDHFPVVARMNLCDGPGPIPASPQVRIARLLPNPPGDETENEEAVASAPKAASV